MTVNAVTLKVAFVAPSNLFDAGSGAAQSVRTMLEQLAKRGVDCRVFTACCFDAPPGAGLQNLLQSSGLVPAPPIAGFNLPFWEGTVNCVRHMAMQLPTQQRGQLTAIEEMLYRDALRAWLAENRLDVAITFGGLLLDIEIQRCLHASGALIAFYLSNPNYGRVETFARVNLILANSVATAEHYARTLQLRSYNIGLFVDPSATTSPKNDQHFVTFINPVAEKGVALFLKLVSVAAQRAPDMRFLVVESRGSLAVAMQRLGFPASLMDRIVVLPKQPHLADVYSKTRILMVPSFWFEAAGRVLLEANANGIPVLASDRGGIPENLAGAGCVLPVPARCTVDHWSIPTDAEIQSWWNELFRMWSDVDYHAELSSKALSVSMSQGIEGKAQNLEILLRSAIGDVARN